MVLAPPLRPGPVAGAPGRRRLSPAARARVLARAAQTVRYMEQAVMLEGRPATLTTYIVWEHRKPRTFSFVREDWRTDLARIVRVDEAARQLNVLVPDRGALIQVVVPSRMGIPEYDDLKAQIERLVGEINGQFSQPDWVPVHYIFRALSEPTPGSPGK